MAGVNRKIESKAYSIGELLRKPIFYRVPVYQRDFAWTIEQIDTLWDDLITALADDKAEYFLGAIVTSRGEDDKKLDIVDGQQRLTAVSMIFASIARLWKQFGDERRSSGVFRDYLGTEDRRTGEIVPKLSLNETNDPLFQAVVLRGEIKSPIDIKSEAYSNKLLFEAFNRVNELLRVWLETDTDRDALLLDIEEFLSNNTNIILIEAGDESDAFITFETLNDRGLDLAISDLVKNFLFSKADSYLDRFKKYWSEIVFLVGGDNMTQFLRYFWNAEYAVTRERELYKAIRTTIKSKASARQMMEKLRKYADYYYALSNPEHTFWTDYSNEYRNHLEALILFKVTQYRPVALAAMDKLKPEQMTKLLRLLTIISFRYTVISALNTGNLDKVYSRAALAITKGEVDKIKDIFEILSPVYVDDDRFVTDFAQKHFTKEDVARYVLAAINTRLENDQEKVVPDKGGKVTLEHIFPKSPKEQWSAFMPKDREASDFVYLIGNLSLLEKGRNRGIANSSFEEKKEKAFKLSSLALNQDVAQLEKWSIDEIEARSKRFARLAREIWRADY